MSNRLLYTTYKGRTVGILYEEWQPLEIHVIAPEEKTGQLRPSVGEIYVGRVSRLAVGIGAAFIEIAPGYPCYFPLSTLSDAVFTKKYSKKPIACGDELLVQVTKEAAKNKLTTVTAKLVFKSGHAVLTHGDRQLGVSSKLGKERQQNLRQLLSGFENDRCGLLLRTSAGPVTDEALIEELEELMRSYSGILEKAPYTPCFTCLYRKSNRFIAPIDPSVLSSVREIIVSGDLLFGKIRESLSDDPGLSKIVRLWDDPKISADHLYRTEHVIQKALGKKVWLPHGGFLVIEPTEALTVVDVNSGKQTGQKNDADLPFLVNKEAIPQIAGQIRLRNLSGIILIDLINVTEAQMNELCALMQKALASDPAQARLIDVTKLGLMELTRKKTGPPLSALLS